MYNKKKKVIILCLNEIPIKIKSLTYTGQKVLILKLELRNIENKCIENVL